MAATEQRLREEIGEGREQLQQGMAATEQRLREEIGEGREQLQQGMAATEQRLRQEIGASAADTRRHFDVVAEDFRHQVQLVAEGVIGIDRKVDQFREEVRDEFARVDRRLLRLEVKVFGANPA
jgi:hypothetical protein